MLDACVFAAVLCAPVFEAVVLPEFLALVDAVFLFVVAACFFSVKVMGEALVDVPLFCAALPESVLPVVLDGEVDPEFWLFVLVLWAAAVNASAATSARI